MIKYSTEIIMSKVFGMFMLGLWLFSCKKIKIVVFHIHDFL